MAPGLNHPADSPTRESQQPPASQQTVVALPSSRTYDETYETGKTHKTCETLVILVAWAAVKAAVGATPGLHTSVANVTSALHPPPACPAAVSIKTR